METEDAVVWEEVFVLHDVPIRKIEEEFASISVQNRKMGVRDTFVGGGSIGFALILAETNTMALSLFRYHEMCEQRATVVQSD